MPFKVFLKGKSGVTVENEEDVPQVTGKAYKQFPDDDVIDVKKSIKTKIDIVVDKKDEITITEKDIRDSMELESSHGRVVVAPWDIDTINYFIEWQSDGNNHLYTCTNVGDKNHKRSVGLVPTARGWICSFCDYTQNWGTVFPTK